MQLSDGVARMGQVVFNAPGLSELKALGLGSCIGLCAFDPVTKIGCIAHIVLPQARSADTPEPIKYADTAIPHMIEEMSRRGAIKTRLKTAIVGGAQLFNFEAPNGALDVGKRNIEAVKRLLSKANLRLVAEEVGGNMGRTVILNTQTGEVLIRQAGTPDRKLATLLS